MSSTPPGRKKGRPSNADKAARTVVQLRDPEWASPPPEVEGVEPPDPGEIPEDVPNVQYVDVVPTSATTGGLDLTRLWQRNRVGRSGAGITLDEMLDILHDMTAGASFSAAVRARGYSVASVRAKLTNWPGAEGEQLRRNQFSAMLESTIARMDMIDEILSMEPDIRRAVAMADNVRYFAARLIPFLRDDNKAGLDVLSETRYSAEMPQRSQDTDQQEAKAMRALERDDE